MNKSLIKLAALVPLIAVATASAQSVTLYFGSQGTAPGCPASNALGNPVLYLAPQSQCNILAAPARYGVRPNYDKGAIDLYMTVGTNGGGGCGAATISSLGLDIQAARNAGDTNTVTTQANGFTVYTLAAQTGTSNNPWSSPSPNTPTLNSGGNLVTDSRAVAVPSGHGSAGGGSDPLFNGGYCAGGPYKAATLAVQSGPELLTAAHPTTTYQLKMAVGNLKITRVYDPSAAQGNPTETVQFGQGDAAVNGSTVGATSATADATIIVRKKGDFGSLVNNVFTNTPDGVVDSIVDANLFFLSVGATNSPCGSDKNYLGDFGSLQSNLFVPQPDGVVDSIVDANLFFLAVGS